MSYRLVYTHRAVKDVKKLDKQTKSRIGETLLRYSEDPTKYAEKLVESKIGTYRFRIGQHRVIFDLEGKDIVVLRIGHRKDIYRKV